MLKVGLDAGHCINTPGKRTPDGIREWSLNSAVCNYIEEYLKGYADVLRTDDRSGNNDVSLVSRKTKAINNCDVLISIHHNASSGNWNSATGIETYVHSNYTTPKANKLAESLAEKMSNYTGLRNRGVKNAKFAVIATSKIPAVLCEGGFMDGEKDSWYIRTEEGQRAYARAVADSIKEYFNLGQVPDIEIGNNFGSSINKNADIFHDGKINCVYDIQEWLNNKYGFNIAQDNMVGPKTRSALIEALQTELNMQFNKGLSIDGAFGPKTKQACINVRKGAQGNITMLIQCALFIKGYNTTMNKIFDTTTENIVKQFQADKGLSVDGIVGKNTFEKLFK